MNMRVVIDGDRSKIEKMQRYVSDNFSECGRLVELRPENLTDFLKAYRGIKIPLASDYMAPLELLFALMPVMRPLSVIKRIDLGPGKIVGVESAKLLKVFEPHAWICMRERLCEVAKVGDGWLLTCEHQVLLASTERDCVFVARLNWLHEVTE